MSALLQGAPARILPLREFLVRHLPERVYVPGTVFAYSNYGTALAGHFVERVSGQPYEQYITEHLLIPLGMNHSAAVQPLPSELAGDMSKGYKYRNSSYDALDFTTQAAELEVPVYFFVGRYDVNAMASLVERYYAVLDAPYKELIWFEKSGHPPLYSEASKVVDVMVNRVLAHSPR